MQVGKNKVVSVHYVLNVLHDGQKIEADSSAQGSPLKYLHGSGMLLPKFEANLEGLTKGDSFEFMIDYLNGYGERDENNVAGIPIESFQDEQGNIDREALTPGKIMPMVDQDGNRFQGVIVEVTESENVIMDFNHPLAGQDLYFSGYVAEVREATPEEIDHGHVHDHGHHHHH